MSHTPQPCWSKGSPGDAIPMRWPNCGPEPMTATSVRRQGLSRLCTRAAA
jgi:hypothetical protein